MKVGKKCIYNIGDFHSWSLLRILHYAISVIKFKYDQIMNCSSVHMMFTQYLTDKVLSFFSEEVTSSLRTETLSAK